MKHTLYLPITKNLKKGSGFIHQLQKQNGHQIKRERHTYILHQNYLFILLNTDSLLEGSFSYLLHNFFKILTSLELLVAVQLQVCHLFVPMLAGWVKGPLLALQC